MSVNPMGALSRIASRLGKDGKGVGLQLRSFNATPDADEDGVHRAQAVFTFDEDFVPEPPKDDEWERFEQEQAKHAEVEREQQAREGLAELAKNLEQGDGIL